MKKVQAVMIVGVTIGALSLVALLSQPGRSGLPNPTGTTGAGSAIGVTSASSGRCSIDGMAAEYGITMTTENDGQSAAGLSSALADVQKELPGASVAEKRVSLMESKDVPDVDGRIGLVVRVSSTSTGLAAGTPGVDGASGSPAVLTCAMFVFDPSSGAFIISFKDYLAAN